MSASLGSTATVDLQAAWRQGAQALREGRAAEAVAAFEQIAAAGQSNAAVWIGVALARRQLGEADLAMAAVRRAAALEPRNLHALMLTADLHADAGDARAATAYYDAVVRVGTAPGAAVAGFERELVRAQDKRERFGAFYEAHLRTALAPAGIDSADGRRVSRALELLLGKTELYLQQPKGFYFPELPNIQFAERAIFSWLGAVEAATPAIRAEAMGVLEEDAAFEPYVQAEANRPFFDDHGMLGNPDWSAFYLIKGGRPMAENQARCPATMAALEAAPLCRIPGRTPSILFSLLRPGAHIAPHHGFTNARFICHLPLIVPDHCAMRVGSQTRAWTEGQACVFDDSIEHEAWNHNAEKLRVVMIFDIWRPELTQAERAMVSTMLQAVDAYGGLPATDD
jgi:aspartyl/asparaginyl beta-hydroxylase (cupin superfamily)